MWKMCRFCIFFLVTGLFLAGGCARTPSTATVAGLTCEYLDNPLGIDVTAPRLSWKMVSDQRGQRQTAWRVIAASSPELLAADEGDLWDSGKVDSGRSVLVPYDGKPLGSRQAVWWKVRVWDADGNPTGWSEPARWEMALLNEGDWGGARWISISDDPAEGPPPDPAPYFRQKFTLDRPIQSARAYISGLGYYEFFLNGERVGDHELSPAFTTYDKRVYYVTYDITGLLNDGENAAGVVLGTGWYNMHTDAAWGFDSAPWRSKPALLCRIEVVYADGGTETIVTDGAWKVTDDGPVVFDGVRNGVTYDARRELTGWDIPGYDDSAWADAVVVDGPAGMLRAQMIEPVKVMDVITPVSVTEVAPDVWVYDLGQNIAGWTELTVEGPAGTEVTMKQGERLYPDGTVEQVQLERFIHSGNRQTDTYILKGDGMETWEPKFAYHGFQYIEVRGFPGTPTLDNIRGKVLHTSFGQAGEFTSSCELFNQIQHCVRWSYIGNWHHIPTDCPHREKDGWTGDAHLVAETGLFNYDVAAAFTKWLHDFDDALLENGALPGIVPTSGWGYDYGRSGGGYGPQWEGAYIIIPWYMYLYRGDTRILSDHYDGFTRYIAHLTDISDDHIISSGIDDHAPAITHTPPPIISTSYYYYCTSLVARMANILDRPEDALHYKSLADTIRTAFNREFLDPATGSYGNGSQTSLACALYFGLAPEDMRDRVLANLVAKIEENDNHLDAGVVGATLLMNTLVDHGRADVAYAIATRTTFPSWGAWMEAGANTLWQKWDDSMSRNHIMFGDIGAWFYKNLGGINADPAGPGFKRFTVRPLLLGDMTSASAEHESPQGLIASAWELAGGEFTLDVTIPPGSIAEVHVPASSAEEVTESGGAAADAEGVWYLRMENGAAVFEVASGRYVFSVPR